MPGTAASASAPESAVGELCPAVVLERHFAVLPAAPADPHGGLEQRELVCPCAEATVAAVGVQLAQDRHQRVGCRLRREVVEFPGPAVGERAAATSELEAGGAQEQCVQALDGVPLPAPRAR